MRKLFYLIATLSVLIIASSIAYYLVIFLPNKEKMKIKQEQVEKEERQNNLIYCLQEQDGMFQLGWNQACKKIGLEENCNLPAHQAESLMKEHNEGRDTCFKLYPN